MQLTRSWDYPLPSGLCYPLAYPYYGANPYFVSSDQGFFHPALLASLPAPARSHGCVYAVEMGGLLKIGRTYTPKKRLPALANVARTHGLSLGGAAVTIPHRGYGDLENRLHTAFSPFRERGEFFKLPLELIASLFSRLIYDMTHEEASDPRELCTFLAGTYRL